MKILLSVLVVIIWLALTIFNTKVYVDNNLGITTLKYWLICIPISFCLGGYAGYLISKIWY